jgi:hypothetical protein
VNEISNLHGITVRNYLRVLGNLVPGVKHYTKSRNKFLERKEVGGNAQKKCSWQGIYLTMKSSDHKAKKIQGGAQAGAKPWSQRTLPRGASLVRQKCATSNDFLCGLENQ